MQQFAIPYTQKIIHSINIVFHKLIYRLDKYLYYIIPYFTNALTKEHFSGPYLNIH